MWEVEQGILINGQFPGPQIDSVTNDNLIISVYNYLTEPFLISWYTPSSFSLLYIEVGCRSFCFPGNQTAAGDILRCAVDLLWLRDLVV